MSEQIDYFEASKYEDEYIEVALIDKNDNDYFYWVSLKLISNTDDIEDAAINLAKKTHLNMKRPDIPDDSESEDDFEPNATAYAPFSREGDEFVFIK